MFESKKKVEYRHSFDAELNHSMPFTFCCTNISQLNIVYVFRNGIKFTFLGVSNSIIIKG